MSDRGLSDIDKDSWLSSVALKLIPFVLFLFFMVLYGLSVYWSQEPDLLTLNNQKAWRHAGQQKELIVGHSTVEAMIEVSETLLHKNGGFISNDMTPPGIFQDNMPAWEYGVLVQLRDMARVLRNDFSRSQSQSSEQLDLKEAEPRFNVRHTSWAFPEAESEYMKGIQYLKAYQNKLMDSSDHQTQFFARSDNLREWLKGVEKRLGNLSQRLSASVVENRENTDLSGDSTASQSTETSDQVRVKNPWMKIDDTFFEARGSCWALINLLKGIEVDFQSVLEKKNATASLRQIIRELEETQETLWSPMILNGSGFGLVANHSLVMSSYIARANAAIIDLRDLLARG
ncbi:MAG: hypothetical protein COW84_07805 [Gammaproteobacteria bacterium CG22_combo_CG10-13_8_21_14_all_40_8]|nr:MAG: hypothetical protein COW84_07805 [Gammaproteobacteria bacterium CG22_combo_CG10-13_8_21_14_all_40_8]